VKRLLLLVLLANAGFVASCKPSAQEGAQRFCARVKPTAPAEQDACTAHYLGLRGFAKDCIDDCVATAADGDAFEGCRENCLGQSKPVQDVCMALSRTDILCVQHYVSLQKSQGKGYGCAARCIVRDKNEAACASACGVNAAPAIPATPGMP
jgi:hypothetical protein